VDSIAKYKKVLIYGQPFNHNSGGGITLTNLFTGWPKEKIAVLFAPWDSVSVSTQICDTYYQIGKDEHKWKFPFNAFKQPFTASGLFNFDNSREIFADSPKKGIKRLLARKVFNPFFNWLGLYHGGSEIILSPGLKAWLNNYKPDIIYMQISSLEGITFAIQLIDYLKIPSALHMMDDWPSTISSYGPFKKYWRREIDSQFRCLLDKVKLHISISDAMSDEYRERYDKEFVVFHNPVDTKVWLPHIKTNFTLDKKCVSVLFSGRIGTGISNSLLEVASAIDSIHDNDLNIKLYIQTTVKEHSVLQQIQKYKCPVINPVAEYDQIPGIFSKADILLLANDFNTSAISFLKLSMPTKASEYMVSGTPVLIYAPNETAVSKFFYQNNCGYCITTQSREAIAEAVQFLINNEEYRKKISSNAVKLALEKFDAVEVRKKFQNMLLAISKQGVNN
jgi:glycosyltransferase involved in cell wall biosynthesis